MRDMAESSTGTSMTVVPHGTTAADSNRVGTGGAWSVERRYPQPADAPAGRGATAGQGRVLNRAGQAVRQVGGGSWAGVAALCAAAAIVAALLVRRARRAA